VDFDGLLLGAAFLALMILGALIFSGLAALSLGRRGSRVIWWPGEAEQKARVLLKQWLSPAQLTQYESGGHFEVVGSHSGKRYRIHRYRQMNIDELDERGARVAVWCFGPQGHLPIDDVMLVQKIALETNERATLTIAHRSH
jgi:hypothetical protein